jgi:hypothetical protein
MRFDGDDTGERRGFCEDKLANLTAYAKSVIQSIAIDGRARQ